MTTPGGRYIDTAFVKIKPDLASLAAETKAGISRAFSGLKQDVSYAANQFRGGFKDGMTGAMNDAKTIVKKGSDEAGESIHRGLVSGAERGGSGMTEAIRHSLLTAKTGLVIGATALGAAAAGAIASGLRTAASMEQAQIAFETLLGSSSKAHAYLDQLKEFAAKTPFELPGLIDASRQLIGVGLNTKETMTTLQAYGDAAGALGIDQDAFNRIMLATSQALSAGTLHAGDLLQMTEAGLPIWVLLSKALHKPVSEIKDLSEQGKLMTKDVLPKLNKQMEKDYGGAMAKQSLTLSGLWSTLMDTFHEGMADVLMPMEPMLRKIIPKAGEAMGRAFKAIGQGMADFFNGLEGNVRKMDQSQRPKLELFGLGLRALAKAFKDGDVTSDGFVGAMERVGVWLHDSWQKVGDLWQRLKGPLATIFANFRDTILPTLTQVWKDFHQPLQDIAVTLGGALLTGLLKFSDWAKDHQEDVRKMAELVGLFWAAWKGYTIITKVILAIKGLQVFMASNPLGLLVLALAGVAAWFITTYQNSQDFRDKVNDAVTKVRDWVGGALTWLKTNVLDPFVKWWKDNWPTIWTIIQQAWALIWPVLQQWWQVLVTLWHEVIEPFVAWVKAHWPEISTVIKIVGYIVIGILIAMAFELTLLGRTFQFVINYVIGPAMRALEVITAGSIWAVRQEWGAFQSTVSTVAGVLRRIWNILSGAFGLFSTAIQLGVGGLIAAWQAMSNKANEISGAISGFFERMKDRIVSAIGDTATWLFQKGIDIITGLWDGILSMRDWLRDKILSFIPDWVKTALGLSSPPEWAVQFGKWIAEGLANGIKRFPGFLANLVKKAKEKLAELAKSIGGGFIPGNAGNPISADIIAEHNYAASLFPQMGWSVADQLDSLITLWNNESGWSPSATNPSSGAYGIAQAWPAEKYASAGPDWRTNPATQIRWGLAYIRDTYGTPSAAWAAWLSRSPHWYEAGAWKILRKELAVLHPGEMVMPAAPAEKFRTNTTALNRAGSVTVRLDEYSLDAVAARLAASVVVSVDPDGLARLVTAKQAAYAVRGGRR
jgi:tape measure domain-containing protein